PRSCLGGWGKARSCERSPAQELGEETADLLAENPAGVEEVVADRGLAASQDLGDLFRLAVLHLAQDERRLLLFGEAARDGLEEARELRVLGVARGLRRRGLLALPNDVERRPVGALAAAGAAEKVDREVGGDAVEPGVERVLFVVAVDLVPHAKEDHLGDVPGVLGVADDAPGEGTHGRGLAGHERFEGDHFAAPRPNGKVPVRQFGRYLAVPALAVHEFHASRGLLLSRYTELTGYPLGGPRPTLS